MNKEWVKNQKGFTIVELLIVIVIIGILAALVIVAYTGIQQRADNSRRIAAAKEWQKLIVAYTSQNGTYPASVINNHICLGTGNPTDMDANPDEDCFASTNVKHPNTTINTAFSTLVSKLPAYPPDKTSDGSLLFVGLSLRAYDTLNPSDPTPKTFYPMMFYYLNNTNQDCGLRPLAVAVSGGYTETSANNSGNQGKLTRCAVILPDPANL